MVNKFEYDVALSFAGEDRAYVEKVAKYLKEKDIKVFYDDCELRFFMTIVKKLLYGVKIYMFI